MCHTPNHGVHFRHLRADIILFLNHKLDILLWVLKIFEFLNLGFVLWRRWPSWRARSPHWHWRFELRQSLQLKVTCFSFLVNLLQLLLLCLILSLLHLRVRYRCCSVRHGVCEVARGAPPDHVRAPSGSARTLARKWAATVRRQLFGALWRVDEREEHDREIRRLPHRLRHVEDTSWEMLHVDGRFSPIGSYQGAKPISLKLLIYLHLWKNHLLHHLLLFLLLLLLLQFLANILF